MAEMIHVDGHSRQLSNIVKRGRFKGNERVEEFDAQGNDTGLAIGDKVKVGRGWSSQPNAVGWISDWRLRRRDGQEVAEAKISGMWWDVDDYSIERIE